MKTEQAVIYNKIYSGNKRLIKSATICNNSIPTFANPFDHLNAEIAECKLKINLLLELVQNKTVKVSSDLVDIKEASKYLHMSKSSIYKCTASKNIPFIKREGSNKLLFSLKSLEIWVNDQPKESEISVVDQHIHKKLRILKVQHN